MIPFRHLKLTATAFFSDRRVVSVGVHANSHPLLNLNSSWIRVPALSSPVNIRHTPYRTPVSDLEPDPVTRTSEAAELHPSLSCLWQPFSSFRYNFSGSAVSLQFQEKAFNLLLRHDYQRSGGNWRTEGWPLVCKCVLWRASHLTLLVSSGSSRAAGCERDSIISILLSAGLKLGVIRMNSIIFYSLGTRRTCFRIQ